MALVSGKSSSTRGTWIEIALQKSYNRLTVSRPPHGGRGLKYPNGGSNTEKDSVVLHTGDVD